MTIDAPGTPEPAPSRRRSDLLVGLTLAAVLAIAAYLRFVGLNWDELTHIR